MYRIHMRKSIHYLRIAFYDRELEMEVNLSNSKLKSETMLFEAKELEVEVSHPSDSGISNLSLIHI